MLTLGKIQELSVLQAARFGYTLGEEPGGETVFLPAKLITEEKQVGDKLRVFLFIDSEGRLTATPELPVCEVGDVAMLTVKACSGIGAFLNWGISRDLFLPFREMSYPVKEGDRVLVKPYVDRTGRLAATMRLYADLRMDSPYHKGDRVTGTVFRVNPAQGVLVAVDNTYFGMIAIEEVPDGYAIGTKVSAYVNSVRKDGKLNLSPVRHAYQTVDADIETLEAAFARYDGVLPFSESAPSETIRAELSMSKAAFKRALGRMLKQGLIEIGENTVTRLPEGRMVSDWRHGS